MAKKTNPKLITYVGIVLDESGSMMRGYKEIISGLTEQVQTLQKGTTKNMETFVTFVTFSDQPILRESLNVKDFDFKLFDTYNPGGMTAMLDAVGDTINYLKTLPAAEDENTSFLLIIASDGEENASKRFNYDTVSEMIQSVKDTKRWTVTYMGANQDLSIITDKLKIDAGNVTMFDASSPVGYFTGMGMTIQSSASYMSARSVGTTSIESFYTDKK